MKHCAFLTTDDLTGYVTDDYLAVAPMRARGFQVDSVPWRAEDVDWDRYAVVVVRSPWDYPEDPERFEAVLSRIAGARTQLRNPLPLMRWNLRKGYLRDLERCGVAVPRTVWGESPTCVEVRGLFDALGADSIVLKPEIGANAGGVFRLGADADGAAVARVATAFAGRAFLAQAFHHPVAGEGEFSLIFFHGALSHAILKSPRAGDFRVQEEHGGRIIGVRPPPRAVTAAGRVLAALDALGLPAPLYARVDLVRREAGADRFLLMELELIEPSLYLRTDPGAADRFAAAIARDAGAA